MLYCMYLVTLVSLTSARQSHTRIHTHAHAHTYLPSMLAICVVLLYVSSYYNVSTTCLAAFCSRVILNTTIYLYIYILLYIYICIHLLILVSISVLQPRQATETELLTIHTPSYVSAALAGTAEKDSSTYFHTKNSVSAGAARLAAGSTMQVAEEGVVVCVWVGVCVCVWVGG